MTDRMDDDDPARARPPAFTLHLQLPWRARHETSVKSGGGGSEARVEAVPLSRAILMSHFDNRTVACRVARSTHLKTQANAVHAMIAIAKSPLSARNCSKPHLSTLTVGSAN